MTKQKHTYIKYPGVLCPVTHAMRLLVWMFVFPYFTGLGIEGIEIIFVQGVSTVAYYCA